MLDKEMLKMSAKNLDYIINIQTSLGDGKKDGLSDEQVAYLATQAFDYIQKNIGELVDSYNATHKQNHDLPTDEDVQRAIELNEEFLEKIQEVHGERERMYEKYKDAEPNWYAGKDKDLEWYKVRINMHQQSLAALQAYRPEQKECEQDG